MNLFINSWTFLKSEQLDAFTATKCPSTDLTPKNLAVSRSLCNAVDDKADHPIAKFFELHYSSESFKSKFYSLPSKGIQMKLMTFTKFVTNCYQLFLKSYHIVALENIHLGKNSQGQ